MSASTDIDEIDKIDDMMDMVRTMTSLGIPTKGLQTLNDMKHKVKETLKKSKNKSGWSAKEVRMIANSGCCCSEFD